MIETQKKYLQNFLLDHDSFYKLSKWSDRFNLFRVLGISKAELKHSNMLAWLLNPKENHQLGNLFLNAFLTTFVNNNLTVDPFSLFLSDTYDFHVYREWKNIDILLVSETARVVIAVENKIKAKEHGNQLEKYRKILEKEFKDDLGWSRAYIYLTVEGDEPSDQDWDIMQYSEISNILEDILKRQKLLTGIELLLENYLDILRREVMGDEELVKLCNEIYRKHKEAIDLIIDNKTDPDLEEYSDTIQKTLQKFSSEGKIIFDEQSSSKRKFVFYTQGMDSLFPNLTNTQSSWGTQKPYRYWLLIQDADKSDSKSMRGYLELGLQGISSDLSLKIDKVKHFTFEKGWGRSKGKFSKKYLRAISSSKKTFDSSEDCEKYVVQMIEDFLKKEREILENCEK